MENVPFIIGWYWYYFRYYYFDIIQNQKTKIQTIQILIFLVIENGLSSIYSEILIVCIIFLSLSVTVTTAERSFSKLKLLKNYLRISISQER